MTNTTPINLDDPARFDLAPDAIGWALACPRREGLIYGSGQDSQLREMVAIGDALGCPPRFPGVHTSKSVPLPVAAYRLAPDVIAVVRDNFHNVNVAVRSGRPLDLRLSEIYEAHTAEWYEHHKARAAGYSPSKYDFSTPAWFSEWSGGVLLVDGETYYHSEATFLEGIEDKVLTGLGFASPYKPGATIWAVAVPELTGEGRTALSILRAVQTAARCESA